MKIQQYKIIFIAITIIGISACGIDYEPVEVFEVKLAGKISGLSDEDTVELGVSIYTKASFEGDPPFLVSVLALQVKNGDWSTTRKAPATSRKRISYIIHINDNPSTHECVITQNSTGRFVVKVHQDIDVLCTTIASAKPITRNNSFCNNQCSPDNKFGILENSSGKSYAVQLGLSEDSTALVSQGTHSSVSIAYGANIIVPILDAGGNNCLFMIDQNNNNYGAGISCDKGNGFEAVPSLYFNGSPLIDAYPVGGDDPSRICVVSMNFPFDHCLQSYGEGSSSWINITDDQL